MKFKNLILGVAVVAASVGCGGAVTGSGIAKVRAISAVASPSSLDFFTDFNTIALGLGAGEVSGYSQQTGSDLTLGLRQSGTTTTLASGILSAAPSVHYSVIAYPTSGSTIGLLALQDDFSTASGTNYELRFLHLDRVVGNVDVYITPPGTLLSDVTPTLSNQGFPTATEYVSYPLAGEISIRFTNAGTKTVIGQEILVTPASGSFKTLMLYDNAGPKDVLFADQN